MNKNYVYFFTRQDISPEQQLVQTAHAALKMGSLVKPINADETYFTVIGVRDEIGLYAVREILDKFQRLYTIFREPDMGDAITSVVTYPIPEDERRELLAFSLLKF